MSVYNGERDLRRSVDSVLAQTLEDFEFIIINDGSRDRSREILAEYERADARVRVFEQENRGLTKALIRGCREARGRYIARQDADDLSRPERLRKQVDLLENHADVALLSCWTRFVGPEGEELFTAQQTDSPEQATAKLRCGDVSRIQGLNGHGSAMFRRRDYERAGGYRPQFWMAQDLDLWLRLTELGQLAFVPEILYEARFTAECISMRCHAAQMRLAQIAIELARCRQLGQPEAGLLEQADSIRPAARPASPRDTAKGLYFLGRCLLNNGDRRGMKYLRQAVRCNPLHVPAWAWLVRYGTLR